MENNLVEIKPEYVYLTIPADWVCVYHKLLVYMADFGKRLIDDCNASCKGNGKNIISCWNLFQSALACRTLGNDKQANLFIDYINKQLDYLYGGTDKEVFNHSIPLAITEDGHLKAIVTCGTETKFYVDEKTGNLYQQYKEGNDTTKYEINNNNLNSQ